jgi:hypothetical protein
MSEQPDRFAAAVRAVFGRSVSVRKIEALRAELIRAGIVVRDAGPRNNPKAASKASEMAAEPIDKMADPSASHGERQTRKQRLLKGPREFRDMRGDLPKRKSS